MCPFDISPIIAWIITYLTIKAISILEYLNTVMSNWFRRYRKEVDDVTFAAYNGGQWRSSSSLSSLPSFDFSAPPSPSLEPESLPESSDCQPPPDCCDCCWFCWWCCWCCCICCCCDWNWADCFGTLWRLPVRGSASAPAPSNIGWRIRRRAFMNQLFTWSNVRFVWLAIWRFSSSVG